MEETVDSGDRSLSPGRKLSPSKSMELSGEIDPETVRSALRDFAQSMKEAERERDESTAKAGNLQRALAEMEEEKAHADQRLQALQKSLGEAEEGTLQGYCHVIDPIDFLKSLEPFFSLARIKFRGKL